ncbi:MAG: PD-(D/E)XK nuclease family protein [Candidatus Thermoplasmatota archaeon]|nr:PD-(D/E)XK nuclease family protein [Candidatus Thermoplasmatota archaeon]
MFNEGADVYHITMTEVEAANLKRDGLEAMTLYSFLRKGVEQYSEKVLVDDYRKERILLSCVMAKYGKIVGPLSSRNLFSIMREIEREEKVLMPINNTLGELKRIIDEHRSALGDILSINDVWSEAETLLKEGKWFRIDKLYVDRYPDLGEREKKILGLLEKRCSVIYLDPLYGDPQKVYEFPTKEEEVVGIARQIIEIGNPESCAVVLQDEYLPLVKTIFDEYSIPYDCRVEERLINTKTFEFVINLIDLVENGFKQSDIRRALTSPLIEGPTRYDFVTTDKFLYDVSDGNISERAEKYIEYWKSRNNDEIDEGTVEQIRSSARKIEECVEHIKSRIDLNSSAKDLLSELFSLLHDFSLPRNIFHGLIDYDRSVKMESVAFMRLMDILRDFAWACNRIEITAGEALKALKAELVQEKFSDKGYGVLIISDEDTISLNVPHKFYCGLSLERFAPYRNPLLTDDECEKIGVFEKRKYAKRRIIAIRSSVVGAVVSFVHTEHFNALKALGIEVEISRYEPGVAFSLSDLERHSVQYSRLLNLAGEKYMESTRKKRELLESREKKIENEYNGIIKTQIAFDSATPGKLEEYVKCPMRFFARYVIGLKSVMYEETESMLWGSLIHSVLRDFYLLDGHIDKKLVDLRGKDEFLSTGRAKIDSIIEKKKPQIRDISLQTRVERAKRISFKSFLEKESSFISEPVYIEREIEKEMQGIHLKGIVDRGDRKEDGYMVFDYKTSKVKNGIDSMQIPLYLYMLGDKPAGGNYYIITDRRQKEEDDVWIDVFKSESPDSVIKELIEKKLPAIVESIRNGYFPPSFVDKKDLSIEPCRNCILHLACDGAYASKEDVGPFAEYYKKWKGEVQ